MPMDSSANLEREGEIGYAVPREWYKSYSENAEHAAVLVNAEILTPEKELNLESKYQVVSCEEWEEIKKKTQYDEEVPYGVVNITIDFTNKESIQKNFQSHSSKKVFDIIKLVLFSHKMTEQRFIKYYRWKINAAASLSEALIKCKTKNIHLEIERKETEQSSEEEIKRENTRPAEFRNVGLSCYMNTALQVLLGVDELSHKILAISSNTIYDLGRKRNTAKGHSKEKCAQLLLAYRSLVKSSKKGGDCGSMLREIKKVLGEIDSRYGRCSEEDAGEVFSLILNNFNYLFEKTKYDSLVSDLFRYNADELQECLDRSRKEVRRTEKNIYKSFVMNGSFGSEKGPHAHVLVVHRNQLLVSSVCVYKEEGGDLLVGNVRKKICRDFQVSLENVVAGESTAQFRVIKREDGYTFASKKNLHEQPVFYIVDNPEEIEFVFLRYLPQKESLGFLTSIFGSGDKRVFSAPFLIKKKSNLAHFLEDSLRIKRRTTVPDTMLELQESVKEDSRLFSSVCVVVSHKHWDATEYINAIKEREEETRDALHIQCVVTNWENRHIRKPSEEEKADNPNIHRVVESRHFCKFSKYFCVQLSNGLGASFKEKPLEKHKLTIEKDSLMLDGGRYALVGILVHHNFGIGGHYVAFTKRGESWYHCNDSTITRSTVSAAISTGYPYGLLYRREEK
ncbi:hypothetical protein NEDG_00613 [Nematocida displodere]|uniref:USP domain-containing protein n=1 Tax=Nematocida displodere TaxID=1805483 RepID=A0A177EDL0_9MICR|nr:hypothetical protein NEDG_00613 [Nematocida displodere]